MSSTRDRDICFQPALLSNGDRHRHSDTNGWVFLYNGRWAGAGPALPADGVP